MIRQTWHNHRKMLRSKLSPTASASTQFRNTAACTFPIQQYFRFDLEDMHNLCSWRYENDEIMKPLNRSLPTQCKYEGCMIGGAAADYLISSAEWSWKDWVLCALFSLQQLMGAPKVLINYPCWIANNATCMTDPRLSLSYESTRTLQQKTLSLTM